MDVLIEKLQFYKDSFEVYTCFKNNKNISFLDSNISHKNKGQYSFIGINPFIILKGNEEKCFINDNKIHCNLFDKLNELLLMYKCENKTEIPFIAGCIGYISYDYGLYMENIVTSSLSDINIPQYYFVFYNNLIIFDNAKKEMYISSCNVLKNTNSSIEEIKNLIKNCEEVIYSNNSEITPKEFKSNFTREEYIEKVSQLKDYIISGDTYISNMTRRIETTTNKSSYDIYKDLRNTNPAPFSALLNFEGFEILSSSPERFLKIKNRFVETRPIKGTRPRGKNPTEDEFYKNELKNSEKDKSELLMIVDLERNDLSKVCKPNSVKVTELFALEKYETVFHLASNIVGELKECYTAVDCIKACFPGGSITGTPKIRSMEIIDELEKLKRGLYTGCIGYFSFDGNADFNIVIRTIIKLQNKVYFGVGGGVTIESIEEEEYQETIDKAKALIRVI